VIVPRPEKKTDCHGFRAPSPLRDCWSCGGTGKRKVRGKVIACGMCLGTGKVKRR
jgi:hypothetical protein